MPKATWVFKAAAAAAKALAQAAKVPVKVIKK